MVILGGIAVTVIGLAGLVLAAVRGSEERERVEHYKLVRESLGLVDADGEPRIVKVGGAVAPTVEIGQTKGGEE